MLKRTPLYEAHVSLGARMVDFVGWEMPVQYAGPVPEHMAVREAAGLFDVSHMGEIEVTGAGALALIQRLTTNDVSKLADNQVQYSMLTNESAGVIDDLLVYRINGEHFLLVVNASNIDKDFEWIKGHATSGDAEVHDLSMGYALLALQGPRAERILQDLSDHMLDRIPYYWSQRVHVDGIACRVSRTGYTGEDGFELIVSADDGPDLWHTLAERHDPIQPTLCGLGARDTLRLEAGMALYGHEITEDTNPFEANLGRVVKLDKGDFVGREALAALSEKPPERRLVGFGMVDNAVPRQGYPIVSADRVVGQVTSGSFSPSLRRNLGMAYVPSGLSEPGVEIAVMVREQPRRAVVVQLPHYPHRTRRR
jgi:aminomethyltransferase